ncbi:MAG: C4-dicarboxylate ABC transporter [Melioribacteraceae bacterium]|nr:MAG: C4-dicarboxylate ABC transporter [Melioribacteraceae bacterium]
MKRFERRDFLKKSAIAAAGIGVAGLSACSGKEKNGAPAILTNKTYNWKMVTSWSPHFPILGEGANRLAREIEEMSGGRLKITVYGGGELVPPLESFDAVSQGLAEMGHSASYYWAGKASAAQFFTSLPFGMNTQQTNAWLFYGGGLDLWRELYSNFNLVPFPAGNTGGQMGGWFNKEIHSLSDLKGLKIRLPGFGGKVLNDAGGTAILSPGGEIYINLERGVIDATDWIGPYHDYLMGFHKIAKYYYTPGWHEPTGTLELMVNKSAYDSLSEDLKLIVRNAAYAANTYILAEFDSKNREYLTKLKSESRIEFKRFPDDVLNAFKRSTLEIVSEQAKTDSLSRKIYDSYSNFQKQIHAWSEVSYNNY